MNSLHFNFVVDIVSVSSIFSDMDIVAGLIPKVIPK
jgi:hypothetical protein